MKKKVQVNKGYNAFTLQVGGNPNCTKILDNNGRLLRSSLAKEPHYLTHICESGNYEYEVETDGEILDIKLEKLELRPALFSVTPSNLDDVYANTEWYDITEESNKLDYIKPALIDYFSNLSFQIRGQLVPEYKLQNAVLGVYDEKTLASYRATIQRFRDEFYRIKEAIESAKTLEELKSVKADFPTEIIPAK
ncbi:hypothetical protein C8R30_12724 [Nitrosomonas nitrosa]|uniref:hypothetical protein n=1 Tax=Nitrosomonas nitrosa TaxID=52442 RepID=UPI000D2FA6AB|nr:hypothetical protein [Nitrosomonas nitrosa]PTQ91920.1 hypothetical protein C8R30_12724 [Nitrosomonas nitrosa]